MPGLRKLRTARVLEAHMYLTVEPGLYFIPEAGDRAASSQQVLAPAFGDPFLSQFLVQERIQEVAAMAPPLRAVLWHWRRAHRGGRASDCRRLRGPVAGAALNR